MHLQGLLISLMLILLPGHKTVPSQAGGRIPVLAVNEKDLAYGAGEKLEYSIHYEFGPVRADVGRGTVELVRESLGDTPVFHCKVYGRTSEKYDWLMKVREDFQSWFTCEGIQPCKFTCLRTEGRYIARNSFKYKWLTEPARIDADVYTPDIGSRSVQIPLDETIFDLPSLFFFARNMDIDRVVPNMEYPMSFVIDDEVFNVHFILHGKETLNVSGLGEVNTVRFSANLIEGEVFKGDGDMTIWVSDDSNRVPVQFNAPLLVGTASGRLVSWEGLRHSPHALEGFRTIQ